MIKSIVPNIGRKFLEEIDKFLADNCQTLKCADIHDIYFQFFHDLKELKGNSNGFTGLSEYLIFRFLLHQLGGSFEQQHVTPGLFEFASKSHSEVRVGQSVPVIIDGKRHYPDIVVYHSNKLIAVAQIKVYITNGLKELEKEIKTLDELKKSHSELRALLIIFLGLSKKGKILPELERISNNKEWFKFLILKENDALLKQKLQDYLGLERITAASPKNSDTSHFSLGI